MKAKKLIEGAMPIKEISAESVRDKRVNHGHLSTLHLWWARRPLPTCRAVVFASLVPDPLDEHCPQAFREAVKKILKDDIYRPYNDIPYTAAFDIMEDNLRNRLMMFIGKFSDKCQNDMKTGKSTPPKDQLSDGSLIKWENKNNPRILRMARELIWVAYNSDRTPTATYKQLHETFGRAFDAIGEAENKLYNIPDRHIETPQVLEAERELKEAIDNFQSQMPSVLDPFAGGGAIPLEAARLGCRSYGNDINPVAHIIEKGSAEFPQKYGKPIVISREEFLKKYGQEGERMAQETVRGITFDGNCYHIPNRLAWDVEYYVKKVLRETEAKIGWMYPTDEQGNKPVAFYWARTATCSNPSCKAQVPMLKGFNLANTSSSKVFLEPQINGKTISFEIKQGKSPLKDGWNNRGNLICPCCGSVTSVNQVRQQSCSEGLIPRLIAVISESPNGKKYSLPSEKLQRVIERKIGDVERPTAPMQRNSNGGDTFPWGYTKWGDLFSNRQLYMLNEFIKNIKINAKQIGDSPYANALQTFIALWFDKIIPYNTTFGVYEIGSEKVQRIFGRQAIPIIFDYPESNPFCNSSGSGLNQLDWIIRYIESECKSPFSATFANASSGEKSQFGKKELTATVTDPPYYDAIAYGDISDFFYVWLKRTLDDVYPINFATPQTPKTEECTALKHHHEGSEEKAKRHFEHKLTEIFDAIEEQTSDIVSIMFAHQSTEAWTTLCNSILDARMNITGSWPLDTEMQGALKIDKSYLESSVTVSCRPNNRKGFGEFREVKRDIERKVKEEVESLYALGFRGADLLTACFGQAVSEFGRYKTVEKADGSTVTVAELLDLAKQTAFNALLQGIDADDETRFYIGWLQMNGMGETDFDDATKFTRVGMNIEIGDIFRQGLLVRDGNKQHLATAAEHLEAHSKSKGTSKSDLLIEQVHRAMLFYKGSGGDRRELLRLIRDVAPDANDSFWRVLASLKELLPAGDDLQQVQGLLQNGENLRHECKDVDNQTFTQGTITFGE